MLWVQPPAEITGDKREREEGQEGKDRFEAGRSRRNELEKDEGEEKLGREDEGGLGSGLQRARKLGGVTLEGTGEGGFRTRAPRPGTS